MLICEKHDEFGLWMEVATYKQPVQLFQQPEKDQSNTYSVFDYDAEQWSVGDTAVISQEPCPQFGIPQSDVCWVPQFGISQNNCFGKPMEFNNSVEKNVSNFGTTIISLQG